MKSYNLRAERARLHEALATARYALTEAQFKFDMSGRSEKALDVMETAQEQVRVLTRSLDNLSLLRAR